MLFTYTFNENKDFLRLYKKGSFISSNACVVYYIKNNAGFNRFGITTGKKVGNAVKRNRARRIIKAAYRNLEAKFPIGFDIIVVARAGCGDFIVKSCDIENFFNKRVISQMLIPPQKNNSIKKNINYKKK